MPGLPAPATNLIWRESRNDRERRVLEDFIAATYRQQHGATIVHFSPRLYGLWEHDRLQAAVGVQRADATSLFLEHYLDVPIERALSTVLAQPVERTALAEIGNLASRRPGMTVPLIRALIDTLVAEECRWLAFTATATVRNGFRRLGLDVHRLADADPTRLGNARNDWGNYYLHRPWVMGGDLLAAWRRLAPASGGLITAIEPAAVSLLEDTDHA
ncbi:thermostable hemolysin [Salinicola sp. LHM]|uniref:thermostable hemolysin n=1 Tax=Salinicola sp. LHM TaxID=3065298 RepID=UPI002ACD4446|nr:thermostable hemolysin [Salinicola sp. LHM]MEC8916273.1 thermostable hemolysin [Pseudomonadota bacterium]MED5499935.1 thermostable hemolysin [Pseudomonadota bacterium]WQH32197.1 thermostable hemolysin [Salinicola sp. LHM]